MNPVAPLRPEWEVADVIREYGETFLSQQRSCLSGTQLQALHDLARCRTQALGGHVERCLDCGRERIAYNSCRNRHCPKCQAMTRAHWLAEQARHLLPVEYFHVVFTLPSEIAELALVNRWHCTTCSSRRRPLRSGRWRPIRNAWVLRWVC